MTRLETPYADVAAKALAFGRRAGALVTFGRRRLQNQRTPFQMTLSLTNRCNFRCEYCDIPGQRREEMTTDEWRAAIDELADAGMGRASLIGGEPMLRKDLGAIIRHLKERGIHVAMNTNGWFVEERADEIRELDLVCLTLDGSEQLHDAQRHPGSYARVIRSLEILRGLRIPVVTMTVLTPRGADNVEHVLRVAREHDFRAFFQLEHDKNCDVNLPIAPRLTDRAIRELAERLLTLKCAGEPVGNSVPILEQHIDRGRYLGTCEGCYAGRYYGYVMSDGTVAPCLLTQWQQTRANGRSLGFARAFHEMPAPEGPGCSCVPTHQVNKILGFDLAVLWDAVTMTLGVAPARR